MSSLSEIPVLSAPASVDARDASAADPELAYWASAEFPRARRVSPLTLVVLGLLAGIGAMAVGAYAVVVATADRASPAMETPAVPVAERQALALLAKPSTERVPFRGSAGRLVLAVGSGGRAAILLRGFESATAAAPTFAWIVGPGAANRAARLDGSERAVFLSAPLGPGDSVVVAPRRPRRSAALAPIVALRG